MIPKRDKFTPSSMFMELCDYDGQSTLDITFKSGSVHRYLFCFPATYQSFKESPSHDTYFSKVIRGHFMSIPIRTHNVGRNKSSPLHQKKQRKTLDHGIKRIVGTVNRAGL